MLKIELIHPQILSVLASSGHGSGILIADGNYPFNTRANPQAQRVYLNFMPNMLNVTDVLQGLLTVIPVEAAHVMLTDNNQEPSIHADFRTLLPNLAIQSHNRFDFYEKTRDADVSLVIATGEQRIYANILLIIGVVAPH